MDRDTELSLIDELLSLKARDSAFLDASTARNPVQNYTSADRFRAEQDKVLRRQLVSAAHSSELQGSGAFLQRHINGLPVLITRDDGGHVHAYLNVCRHRGMRLVAEQTGCRHRFTCPYHAWSYANTGELIAAPQFEAGFPAQSKAELGLRRLHCEERFGFIWLTTAEHNGAQVSTYGDDLDAELEALDMQNMVIAVEHTDVRKVNWKTLLEGGLEAYHFKVAHKNTIGPYFENNLSTYQTFGPHIRSVLARSNFGALDTGSRDSWRLREHANLLYTLFPTTQLLVQQDHVIWIRLEPISVGETHVRVVTLAPRELSANQSHWQRNHGITAATLNEDFAIGEAIQAGALSGANDTILFGRFEGALAKFNATIQQALD